MIKKALPLVLIGLLINMAGVRFAYAGSKEEKEARFVEKVKESINRLGTGETARVEVKLHDKTKLKGYISQAGDESFVVVDAKTGAATKVAYPQVKQVKGNNLSKGAQIAIAVGIMLAVGLVLAKVYGGN
jgi:hypothetical protein